MEPHIINLGDYILTVSTTSTCKFDFKLDDVHNFDALSPDKVNRLSDSALDVVIGRNNTNALRGIRRFLMDTVRKLIFDYCDTQRRIPVMLYIEQDVTITGQTNPITSLSTVHNSQSAHGILFDAYQYVPGTDRFSIAIGRSNSSHVYDITTCCEKTHRDALASWVHDVHEMPLSMSITLKINACGGIIPYEQTIMSAQQYSRVIHKGGRKP